MQPQGQVIAPRPEDLWRAGEAGTHTKMDPRIPRAERREMLEPLDLVRCEFRNGGHAV